MANFVWINGHFEIGHSEFFRKFAWKIEIFYPDPQPPRFQIRLTPLVSGRCTDEDIIV